MKNITTSKIRLEALAAAFDHLDNVHSSNIHRPAGYWAENARSARQISDALDTVLEWSKQDVTDHAFTLKTLANICRDIRNETTAPEGQEFWQNHHQNTANLSDEIADFNHLEELAEMGEFPVY